MSTNLPLPPVDENYKVWLVRNGRSEEVGTVECYPNNVCLALVQLVGGETVAGMTVTLAPAKKPGGASGMTVLTAAGGSEPLR